MGSDAAGDVGAARTAASTFRFLSAGVRDSGMKSDVYSDLGLRATPVKDI